MTDITITATTPPVITATVTSPTTVALSVSAASTVTVSVATVNAPTIVNPSVADNFVSFSNTAGAQKDSGKGLTHLVYTMQTAGIGAINPADGSTYYFGGDAAATTGANIRRMYFPFSGTLVYAQVNIQVFGTLGDAEAFSAYIRINNTTDLTITSIAQATATYQQYQAALSQAVIGGTTYFEGKITFPTWATTNPTTVKAYFIVGVQV